MDSTARSSWWSVTINNPTPADDEEINLARQAGWKVLGQEEKGEEGTPHYQLAVQSPTQVRFSAVKKRFSRAHIEAARKPSALAKYVSKEETRVRSLVVQQDMYPSLSKFWELISDEIDARNPYIIMCWEYPPTSECPVIWDDRKAGYPMPSPLEAFNDAAGRLIRKGYHVESIAANPYIISQWKKFYLDLIARTRTEAAQRYIASQEEQEVSVEVAYNAHQDNPPPPPPPPGWTPSSSPSPPRGPQV